MTDRRRRTDSVALLAVLIALAAFAMSTGAFLLGLGAIGSVASVSEVQAEAEERRDQNCLIFERNQLKDVRRLERMYEYLVGLTPRQLREPLNQAVLISLSEAEGDAREDDAPPYCDAPNVGLPEPDAVVPDRPPELRKNA